MKDKTKSPKEVDTQKEINLSSREANRVDEMESGVEVVGSSEDGSALYQSFDFRE